MVERPRTKHLQNEPVHSCSSTHEWPMVNNEEVLDMITRPPCSAGVYQIRCKPTGKIYIGSAVDLRARWEHHRGRLRRGDHRNRYLQNAWVKYGEVNFEFSVLEFVT